MQMVQVRKAADLPAMFNRLDPNLQSPPPVSFVKGGYREDQCSTVWIDFSHPLIGEHECRLWTSPYWNDLHCQRHRRVADWTQYASPIACWLTCELGQYDGTLWWVMQRYWPGWPRRWFSVFFIIFVSCKIGSRSPTIYNTSFQSMNNFCFFSPVFRFIYFVHLLNSRFSIVCDSLLTAE